MSQIRWEEPLQQTWSLTVWEKVEINIVYMPKTDDGFGFIVFAREGLNRWVEGDAIKVADAKEVAKFIYEDVICQHGCSHQIVFNWGNENLNLMKDLLEHYRVK